MRELAIAKEHAQCRTLRRERPCAIVLCYPFNEVRFCQNSEHGQRAGGGFCLFRHKKVLFGVPCSYASLLLERFFPLSLSFSGRVLSSDRTVLPSHALLVKNNYHKNH